MFVLVCTYVLELISLGVGPVSDSPYIFKYTHTAQIYEYN